ncbi:MFS transporter [Lentzea sp. NPDC059081]|uniref:MFS transporter n=1 Tax=Lentzea sp. NPDC059081 TaxID=3346719 RepID=UPI0036A210AF
MPRAESRGGPLVWSALLMAVGNGAFMTCSALYFTRVSGLTVGEFGLGLSIAGAVGLFAGVPLGHLADRFGPRGMTALLFAVHGLAVAAYLLVHGLPAFVAVACLYVVSQRGARAAQQALVGALPNSDSLVLTQARMRSVSNIGLAAGAALGGLALQSQVGTALSAVLVANAFALLASAALLLRLPAVSGTPHDETAPSRWPVFRDMPFLALTVVSAVLSLHFLVLDLILPLWIVQHTRVPQSMITALFLINTVAVVAFQVRVGNRVRTVREAVSKSWLAGLALLVTCVLFALSAHGSVLTEIVLLVAAGAVHAGAEILFSTVFWVVSFDLAPEGRRGQYQGFFFTGFATAAMVAPVLLTFLIITWDGPGWLVLGALGVAGGLAVGPIVAWADRRRAGAPPCPSVGSDTA